HEIRDGGEKSSITTDVKNLAASVTAGGNLTMKAGQDVNVIGSNATAGKDINIHAGRDFNMTSVGEIHKVEGREKDGKKRIKTSDEQTTQASSVLTAGRDFTSQARRDTTLVAGKISAGNEAYLYSDRRLGLLAGQNSAYILYDMKKNSGWGNKQTRRDEVTQVTHVGTQITAGGDIGLISGSDQLYQRANLISGKDVNILSGGSVTFEAVKDLHQESHTKSKNDLAWTSSAGRGNTDETLRQTQVVAEGKFAIQAVNGLKVDINHIDQKTVAQTIDVMVKADPQLTWLKDAEKRGDVDWRKVQEVHDSFKYSHSSLGQGAMLAIIIVVTALTAGAASGPLGAAAGASAGSGTAMAAAGSSAMVTAGTATGVAAAGWGNVMITTALSSMAGTAAASTINNKGNLGKVLDDVTSTDALKGYATGAVIAGFGAAFTNGWGRELTSDGNYKTVSYAERVKAYTANTALKGVLSGADKKSWLTIASTGAMTEVYEYSAGRGPDVRSGVDRDGGAKYDPLEGGYVPQIDDGGIIREGKNIGLNRTTACDSFYSVCHGTPVSKY
ncbi:DUF637 domain-containing protein, partial [Pseudomonas poae]|uniref:DUF637 domain-containing protein n=1 Tax=Pseudomonas poae TaxID=200451 RepID=UPI0021CC83EB